MARTFVFSGEGGSYDFVPMESMPGSRQISPDRFEEWYDQLGLIRPPYDFELLSNLFQIDTWHRRAIYQKAADTTGIGWEIKKDQRYTGTTTPKEEDRQRLVDFFSNCSVEQPFEDLMQAVWVDYDVLGNAAIEIVRNGKGEPVELYHIPFKTLRVHRSQQIFAQVRGAMGISYRSLQWFIEFDSDPSTLPDVLAPPTADTKFPFEADNVGELLMITSYDGKSSFYGLPESISAVAAIAANQAVSDYNLGRLSNRGVPDYIMTLSGVELDPDTQAQIKEFLNQTKKKNLKDGPKILTFEVGTGSAQFEKVTPDTEDANWLSYRRENRDEILGAHGVPKYRIGIAETGSMGQNVAIEQSRIYAMSVIRPRRQRMEHILNSWIIEKGFGIHGWRLEFNELDMRNEKMEADTDFQRTAGVPVETINEIRRKRGLGPDLNGGDRVMMRVGHEIIQVAHIPGTEEGSAGDDYPNLPGVATPETSQEVPHLAGPERDTGQQTEELRGPPEYPQDTPYTNAGQLRNKPKPKPGVKTPAPKPKK